MVYQRLLQNYRPITVRGRIYPKNSKSLKRRALPLWGLLNVSSSMAIYSHPNIENSRVSTLTKTLVIYLSSYTGQLPPAKLQTEGATGLQTNIPSYANA
jgi:hypothetical protein